MKSLHLLILLSIFAFLYSCQNDDFISDNNLEESVNTKGVSVNGGLKIAILSDIHVMDPSLLVEDGPAFQAYLNQDPKLLQFSSEILQATVNNILSQKASSRPNLILICGDLTKDGEKVSHEKVISILNPLLSHGIKVLVTPGNHDVNNPEAVRFIGSSTEPVQTIQANEFKTMYANFGFNDAISTDPNSLSYVNKPVKDLWVITIDASKYYNNGNKAIGSGVILPETMNWIKQQLAEAKSKDKTVIGMMHHGLTEHYVGQQQIDYGYVVDNSDYAVNELIDAGMKIILTGHYHASDITKRVYNGKFIYDVETGSTVNYPCTYRLLTITGNTYRFEKQNTTYLMGSDFDNYAKNFLSNHLIGYFEYILANVFGVPTTPVNYAGMIAPYYVPAAMAHFAGDEVMPDISGELATLNAIDQSGTLSFALTTLWTDINTPDNNVTLYMQNGNAK